MSREEVALIAATKAAEHGLDFHLLMGICEVESNFNQLAIRYEPSWRYLKLVAGYALSLGLTAGTEQILQSSSWGVMQVMGSVIRENGYTGNLLALACDLNLQIEHGCLVLKKLTETFNKQEDVIAAYNAGTPVKIGPVYSNQQYVDKVKAAIERNQRSLM